MNGSDSDYYEIVLSIFCGVAVPCSLHTSLQVCIEDKLQNDPKMKNNGNKYECTKSSKKWNKIKWDVK